ncbi:MAG TPA: IS91 family transposase [Candidatus Angelobacter sp.]|nr:IS91 family transposase [Candidatus Angelobacter sp.]
MTRPLLELADLVAAAGDRFLDRPPAWFTWLHQKLLLAVLRCRTAALGGHLDRCSGCGHQALSYNSCRNRHCPKCQGQARDRWLDARRSELLATPYSHVVFTVPHQLAPLALQNKAVIYSLLFRCSAETLMEIAADPKHLGAEIGFFSVLHTWNQKLQHHPHVHCVVPAGGLSPDHTHWIRTRHEKFFLPEKVLGEVFRGKFVEALQQAHASGQLQFHGVLRGLAQPRLFRSLIRQLFARRWVAYCKRPFAGPEQVLRYLGAYTHRVAISNHRLISLQDGQVTFRWRDRAHKNKKRLLTLPVEEFLRRFLLHLLPRGFVRIRHFGFLAGRRRGALLPLCKQLLPKTTTTTNPAPVPGDAASGPSPLWVCPQCGGPMFLVERLTATQIKLRSPPPLRGS